MGGWKLFNTAAWTKAGPSVTAREHLQILPVWAKTRGENGPGDEIEVMGLDGSA